MREPGEDSLISQTLHYIGASLLAYGCEYWHIGFIIIRNMMDYEILLLVDEQTAKW